MQMEAFPWVPWQRDSSSVSLPSYEDTDPILDLNLIPHDPTLRSHPHIPPSGGQSFSTWIPGGHRCPGQAGTGRVGMVPAMQKGLVYARGLRTLFSFPFLSYLQKLTAGKQILSDIFLIQTLWRLQGFSSRAPTKCAQISYIKLHRICI